MRHGGGRAAEAGFSLIEVLAAVALMGVILFSLSLITGQWLPAWRRAYDRVQRSESLMIAFDRVAADIGAAELVVVDRVSKTVLFDGTERAVTLVRNSIGPNSDRGLELVRIGEIEDLRGPVLTRSRVAYVPGASNVDPSSAAVVLLRPPYRLSFAFAGRDGAWRSFWRSADALPAAVRITVGDTQGQRQPIVRIVPVRAELTTDDVCGRTCKGGEGSDPTASSSHPDGEPPTLEQVTGRGRDR